MGKAQKCHVSLFGDQTKLRATAIAVLPGNKDNHNGSQNVSDHIHSSLSEHSPDVRRL